MSDNNFPTLTVLFITANQVAVVTPRGSTHATMINASTYRTSAIGSTIVATSPTKSIAVSPLLLHLISMRRSVRMGHGDRLFYPRCRHAVECQRALCLIENENNTRFCRFQSCRLEWFHIAHVQIIDWNGIFQYCPTKNQCWTVFRDMF